MLSPRAKLLPDAMNPGAIGRRLTIIREAFGLSKSEIADQLDISRSQWSPFENGHRAIPYHMAARIVAHYGVTLDFIYLGRPGGMDFMTVERLREFGADL